MNFLTGLHGTVAVILICTLLFVDEAGIPLPIAPNEVLLLLAGVLIASGSFPVWVIFPVAYVAMAAGMIAGYSWARSVGQTGLQALADRLRAGSAYQRAGSRLRSSSPWGIAVSRMVPGVRPYATLICGAAGVELRVFLLGALPALLVWEILLIAAGVLVGLPLAHLLGRIEKLVVRGGLFIALTIIVWLAIRDVSPDRRGGIARLAPRVRASVALIVDATIVVVFVGGASALVRALTETRPSVWIELLVAGILLIGLLFAGRSIQTPGEALFDTHYWHHHPTPEST